MITQRKNYLSRIDALFNGGKAKFREFGVKVFDKYDMLDMLGYDNLPVILAEGKFTEGLQNHPRFKEGYWKKVPEWLENPAAVFDSDTQTGRLVFIAPELLKGVPIRMIVEPDIKENNIKVHLLVNSYDAIGKVPTARWLNEGLLRYLDNGKSREFLTTSRL